MGSEEDLSVVWCMLTVSPPTNIVFLNMTELLSCHEYLILTLRHHSPLSALTVRHLLRYSPLLALVTHQHWPPHDTPANINNHDADQDIDDELELISITHENMRT